MITSMSPDIVVKDGVKVLRRYIPNIATDTFHRNGFSLADGLQMLVLQHGLCFCSNAIQYDEEKDCLYQDMWLEVDR